MDTQFDSNDEVRACFIQAFKALYPESGMRGLSISTLANKAGYSRATFYRYFASLYDILELVEIEATPYREMKTITENVETISMEEITALFLDGFHKREPLIRMLVKHEEYFRYMGRMHAALEPAFRALANKAYDLTPFELDCLAEYLTSAKLSLFKKWALGPAEMSLGYMTKVTDAILEGGFWDSVSAASAASQSGVEYERRNLHSFEINHPWIEHRRGC